VPAALGAYLCRRPIVLVEPNATAGLANRALSRVAAAAAVAWPAAARALSCPARETGVPVRREFVTQSAALPPGPPWRLLVLGGSQGATTLNRLVPEALRCLRSAPAAPAGAGSGIAAAIEVLHQAGRGKEDATRALYAACGVRAEVTPFLDDVPAAMAASHLVLSRAGAVTLAEICAAGRPALLFPLALAAGHQLENARALERAGAAEVVEAGPPEPGPEAAAAAVDAQALAARLGRLLERPRLESMAAAARALARPGAAAAIADLVEETVSGR
jgi:UDP-N-acetylglucosamine--N-acetylmuramyl-(pentapeptide) pyrophosphoryl-undecaprenol N-acetylglucosamine transferase